MLSPKQYNVEDIGLFIGLVTSPYKKVSGFYRNDIKEKMFSRYKEGLINNLELKPDSEHLQSMDANERASYDEAIKEFKSHLYEPKAYCVLGSWDLAVLSLVEDFEFGVRTFQAFSPIQTPDSDPTEIGTGFSYQVVTAFSPLVSIDKKFKPYPLADFWKDIVKLPTIDNNKPNKKLPLIGICSLKINNSILIGTDLEFYQEIIRTIATVCFKYKKPSKRLRFLVLETMSWNEIEILIFSDSYKLINRMIQQIKSIRIKDLYKLPNCSKQEQEFALKTALEKSLIRTFTKEHKDGKGIVDHTDVGDSHVFVKSIETLGFDIEIMDEVEEKISNEMLPEQAISTTLDTYNLDQEDQLRLTQRWYIKPGHIGSVQSIFQETYPQHPADMFTTLSNSDYTSFFGEDLGDQPFSSKRVVQHMLQSMTLPNIDQHIHQILSVPEVAISNTPNGVGATHISIHKGLKNLQFRQKKILDIHLQLRRVGVSKIMVAKVVNAFATFNEGVTDSTLYGYFIELYPFLDQLSNTISKYYDKVTNDLNPISLVEFESRLYNMTEDFLRAYNNRLQQSHKMLELSDYNLEFKGGIHQLSSAFDSVYKLFCAQLAMPEGFTYIMSSPGVSSKQYSVKLNFFHIYQPEILFIIIAKEVANFVTDEYRKTKPLLPKTEFRNPQQAVDMFREKLFLLQDYVERITQQKTASKNDLDRSTYTIKGAQDLRHVLRSDFEDYFLSDLISFMTVFNSDFGLYCRCFWLYYLQDSLTYNSVGKLCELNFVENYVRLVVLQKTIGNSAALECPDPFLEPYFKQLKEKRLLKVFEDKISKQYSIGLTSVTSKIAKELNLRVNRNLRRPRVYVSLVDICRSLKESIQSPHSIFAYFSLLDAYNMMRKSSSLDKLADSHLEKLKIGEPVSFSMGNFRMGTNDKRDKSGFESLNLINRVLSKYMGFLFASGSVSSTSTVLNPKPCSSVLKRYNLEDGDSSGRPDIDSAWRGTNVLIDPRGGTFLVKPHARREHFMRTVALMRSLWAFSNEYKMTLMDKLIHPESEFDRINRVEPTETGRPPTFFDLGSVFYSHSSKNEKVVLDMKDAMEEIMANRGHSIDVKVYQREHGREFDTLTNMQSEFIANSQFVLFDVSLHSLTSTRCMQEYMQYVEHNQKNKAHPIPHALVCFNRFDDLSFKQVKRQILRAVLKKYSKHLYDKVSDEDKGILRAYFKLSDKEFKTITLQDFLKRDCPYLDSILNSLLTKRLGIPQDFWETNHESGKPARYKPGGKNEKMPNYCVILCNKILMEMD